MHAGPVHRGHCPAGSQIGTTYRQSRPRQGCDPAPPWPGASTCSSREPTDAGTLGHRAAAAARHRQALRRSIDIQTQKLPTATTRSATTVHEHAAAGDALGSPIADITLKSLALNLNARTTSGTGFLTNPTSCQPAESEIEVDFLPGQQASRAGTIRPDRTATQVPFDAVRSIYKMRTRCTALVLRRTSRSPARRRGPAAPVAVVQGRAPALPARRHARHPGRVRRAAMPDAELEADACPARTRTSATRASRAGAAAGLHRGRLPGARPGRRSVYAFGAVLRGPAGREGDARGGSFIEHHHDRGRDRAADQLAISWACPQIPFTRFELKLDGPVLLQPAAVPDPRREGSIVGHSGAVADVSRAIHGDRLPARPKGATPMRARSCRHTSHAPPRTGTHGAPLAFPSCNPPAQQSELAYGRHARRERRRGELDRLAPDGRECR